MHHMTRAQRTKAWRQAGQLVAKSTPGPELSTPVTIDCVVHRKTNRRQDAANIYPTLKAVVDGIVDAGVLPDDCDEIVSEVRLRRGTPWKRNGQPIETLTITIIEDGHEPEINTARLKALLEEILEILP